MRYLFKELQRHLWRTAGNISGYIIASLFISLLISIYSSNEKGSLGILKGTGTHFIVYIPSNSACCAPDHSVGSVIAEGVNTQMLDFEALNSIRKMPGIRDAAPYLLYKDYDESFKTEISIGGIDTSNIATKNNVCAATNLVSGKYNMTGPDEIVAEESFATAHNLKAGTVITIYNQKMYLAGIINSGIKPGKADLYSSIENVRLLLKDKLKCNSAGFDMNIVLVEVADSRNQNQVINRLKKEMNSLNVSSYNCFEPASKVMGIIEKTSASISILVFLFLIIFSAKTQLTSVMERIREIGILKSLGWSNSRLSLQLLLSSILQALIGASIGILSAILIILLLNYYKIKAFDLIEFQVQISGLVLLTSILLAGGIIASIFPILKICRTNAGEMINNYL